MIRETRYLTAFVIWLVALGVGLLVITGLRGPGVSIVVAKDLAKNHLLQRDDFDVKPLDRLIGRYLRDDRAASGTPADRLNVSDSPDLPSKTLMISVPVERADVPHANAGASVLLCKDGKLILKDATVLALRCPEAAPRACEAVVGLVDGKAADAALQAGEGLRADPAKTCGGSVVSAASPNAVEAAAGQRDTPRQQPGATKTKATK